jgi:glyoxylase-like metal-dependent hydrolase (beta-lactamase superfamily II)
MEEAASDGTIQRLTPAEVYAKAQNIVDLLRGAAAQLPITVHPLRGDITLLEGSGGNIAVLPGRDGKLLVDAGLTASRPRMMQALDALDANPIRYLVNTHWHFDHADGNAWLNSQGATIVAHENTANYLSKLQRVEDWDFDFAPLPPGGVPTEIFSDEKTLSLNGTQLTLKYYGPAHTDSDISVRFDDADVLHTGDTYWNGIYPFIDYSTGGSITGMIAASDENLAASTDQTIIIPGHGHPVSNRTELKAFRDMLVEIHANVSNLKTKGMSLDEIIAAKPTAAYDEKWGQFVISPAFFTRLVYEGV